ncbi:MAG: CHRD domain-containing protein [Phycisphaeraceae bacterium]|nr:CHRD domain-containing protein [Phycisphaeraceae bacterium]
MPFKSAAKIGSAAALVAFGAISQGALIHYEAFLDGPSESPPNASPGTGFATFDFDTVLHTMKMHVEFTGLIGTTTASHIHAPTAVPFSGTAGVATTTPTFAGFPLGVTSGIYDITLDLTLASSWNPAYITANGGTTAGAESAFMASIAAGKAYLNIHTASFPGGEIRGFLRVPSPSALGLAGIGGLVMAARRRR